LYPHPLDRGESPGLVDSTDHTSTWTIVEFLNINTQNQEPLKQRKYCTGS